MASKSFLTDIQLNQNQLLHAVIETSSTTPAAGNGVIGQLVYNTTDKTLLQHDGTDWKVVGKTIAYDSNNDKVVVSVGGSTEKESLVNIVLGSSYTPVTGGIVTTTDTLGDAINALDTAITTGGSGSVTGDATTFVKSVALSGQTLSGTTQAADSDVSTGTSIPTTAAVKTYVDDSVNSMSAWYLTKNAAGDPFATKAELTSASTFYSGGAVKTPSRNDYVIVQHDESQPITIPGYASFTDKDQYIGYYIEVSSVYTLVTAANVSTLSITPGTTAAYDLPSTRYINTSSTSTPSWSFQYIVNESGLTASQIAALNSGITLAKVTSYDNHVASTSNPHSTSISNLTDTVISSPTSGEVLSYNGSEWVNSSASSGTVTSVQVQATSPVVSSTDTAQTTSLNTTISLASGYGDTQNPYGNKNPKRFLAGPSSGTPAAPTFRAITFDDISSALSSGHVTFTTTIMNPALTPTNGVAMWIIPFSDLPVSTGVYIDPGQAIVSITEYSTKKVVMADVENQSSEIRISFNTTSNISSGTYKVIVQGPLF